MAMIALGKITVAAAGTPVQIQNTTNNPTGRTSVQSLMLQALPGNVGVVYVGLGGLVKGTLVQAIATLAKPSNATTGPFDRIAINEYAVPAGVDFADVWIDADTAGDGIVGYAFIG